jgi:hypothetical protein
VCVTKSLENDLLRLKVAKGQEFGRVTLSDTSAWSGGATAVLMLWKVLIKFSLFLDCQLNFSFCRLLIVNKLLSSLLSLSLSFGGVILKRRCTYDLQSSI